MTIYDFVNKQSHQPDYIDEYALISNAKNIKHEYRFFIVDKKVITGSAYRINGQLKRINIDDNKILFDVTNSYARLYQPHDIFTMDIAELDDNKYKIIEYNCWNASGLYYTNVEKIVLQIMDYMKR